MSLTHTQLGELKSNHYFRTGIKRLEWHQKESPDKLEFNFMVGGKLPRKHQSRSYRFCVQDVVLGITVLSLNQINQVEVDVFLTASIPEYESDSGARALALMLISEAFHSGGTMEIKFTKNVESGHVPQELVHLASNVGVEFSNINEGIISSSETIQFYIALTGFSPQMRELLRSLDESGRISAVQVCYSIQRGIWERSEVEAIVLTAPNSARLLSGWGKPEYRHLNFQDVVNGRGAVLYGNLLRHLRARSHSLGEKLTLLEDDDRELEVSLDGDSYAATFLCQQEDIKIPWLFKTKNEPMPENWDKNSAGRPFTVMIRARDGLDLMQNLSRDLYQAGQIHEENQTGPVYVLVPRDFEKISSEFLSAINKEFPAGTGIMVYREFVSALDEDVYQRLKRTRGLRE